MDLHLKEEPSTNNFVTSDKFLVNFKISIEKTDDNKEVEIIDLVSDTESENNETTTTTVEESVLIQKPFGTNKIYDLLESYDLIHDFYMMQRKPFETKTFKFYAQLTKIYDLTIKLLCLKCEKIYNICNCSGGKIKESKVDLSCKLLIDDHTGLLKISYKNVNYNLNDKQTIFYNIATPLLNLLKFIGRLNIPIIPNSYNNNDSTASSSQMATNKIVKVVYNYLHYCILNSYFLFDVKVNHIKNFYKQNGLNLINSDNINDNLALTKGIFEADCINLTSINSIF